MLAKYISETTIDPTLPRMLTLANGSIVTGDVSSHTTELKILGFLPVMVVQYQQEVPSGWHLTNRYTTDGDTITCTETLEQDIENVEPPRSFSKRKLMNALKGMELWTAVKGYMEQNDLWDDWEASTTLDEDDPLIQQACGALKLALGLTDEQLENILAASVAS